MLISVITEKSNMAKNKNSYLSFPVLKVLGCTEREQKWHMHCHNDEKC